MSLEFVARNGVIALNNSQVTGSLSVSNGITGNLTGTASYATTGSYSVSSSQAVSASYALTASYALNGGTSGGSSTITVSSQGTTQGTASYFDFSGAGVSLTLLASTASINIPGGGSSGGSSGLTTTFTQSVAAATWTFTHNLNTRTPLVQVYDSSYNQIVPQYVSSSNAQTVLIGLGVATAGYAVASTGGTINVTGSNVILNQSVAATTWSFVHNLNTQYPVFTIYNSSSEVIIPQKIVATDATSSLIYFPTTIAGYAVASVGGYSGTASIATSSSYAQTASNVNPLTQSLSVSGSITTTGTLTAQTLVVQTITSSVVYSSGSNIFGNSVTNVQQMTGSLKVTGSITQTGTNTTSSFDGLVGIGTTTPAYTLDVSGTGRFTGALTGAAASFGGNLTVTGNNFFTLAATNVSARIGEYDATNRIAFTANQNSSDAQDDATKPSWGLVFNANSTDTAYIGHKAAGGGSAVLSSLMTITGGGNVGIGTSSPTYTLDVSGTGRFTGALTGASGTFSQSSGIGIIIQSDWDRSATNNNQLYIRGNSNTNKQLRIGYDTTGNVGYIQALTSGTSVDNLLLNPSGGNVGIGTSSPNARLSLGNTTSSAKLLLYDGGFTGSGGNGYFAGFAIDSPNANDTTLLAHYQGALVFGRYTNANDTSAITERMRITSGGELQVAYSGGAGFIRSQATYTNTSANVPNMYVGSAYEFGRGTASSMRYKENINDWNESGLDTILALKPKTFTYKEEYYKYPERIILGLIAEEVAETCKYLADYENEDGSGQVENVRYAYIVVPLIKAIQEMNTKLDEQNQTIQNLQEQINILAK